jgi:hypothetical protein
MSVRGSQGSKEEHRGGIVAEHARDGCGVALIEKLKVRFDGEDRRELLKIENMLRTFAATESR